MLKILKYTVSLYTCLVTSPQDINVVHGPLAGQRRRKTLASWQVLGSTVRLQLGAAWVITSTSLSHLVPLSPQGSHTLFLLYGVNCNVFTALRVESLHPPL